MGLYVQEIGNCSAEMDADIREIDLDWSEIASYSEEISTNNEETVSDIEEIAANAEEIGDQGKEIGIRTSEITAFHRFSFNRCHSQSQLVTPESDAGGPNEERAG